MKQIADEYPKLFSIVTACGDGNNVGYVSARTRKSRVVDVPEGE
jgi:hypothetical protein